MGSRAVVVLYACTLIAVVVSVDVLFFQDWVLGTTDGQRRDRPGVLGDLLAVPEDALIR